MTRNSMICNAIALVAALALFPVAAAAGLAFTPVRPGVPGSDDFVAVIEVGGAAPAFGRFMLDAGVPDSDGDGISDSLDNCTLVANPDQRDTNGDGLGNICDADLDNDCAVTFPDLGIMRSVFFTTDADADLNGDGAVSFADLGLMRAGFFRPPGPSGLPDDCD